MWQQRYCGPYIGRPIGDSSSKSSTPRFSWRGDHRAELLMLSRQPIGVQWGMSGIAQLSNDSACECSIAAAPFK
jgi:hypothetical protein